MECHLAGRWISPYIAHITKVKMEVGMVAGPISKRHVEIVLDHHFLAVTNAKISALHLPALEPIDKFAVMGHVEESDESQVLCILKAVFTSNEGVHAGFKSGDSND